MREFRSNKILHKGRCFAEVEVVYRNPQDTTEIDSTQYLYINEEAAKQLVAELSEIFKFAPESGANT